jgi:phosphohistidine phosphatase
MPELYILRHGIAQPRKEGRPDAGRTLTREGRAKLSLVLGRARQAKVAPSVILTSPFVRAVQTAEMAAEALAPKARIIHTDALIPGSSPSAVYDEIRKYQTKGPVLIAGHEPLLGETLSFLAGVDHGIVDLKKGALACLDLDSKQKAPRAVLLWLMTPKICRNSRT